MGNDSQDSIWQSGYDTAVQEALDIIEEYFKQKIGSTSCTCFRNEVRLVKCSCCDLKEIIGRMPIIYAKGANGVKNV